MNKFVFSPNKQETPQAKPKQTKCRVSVMPPKIDDNDIVALFNGLLQIVKRKSELDVNAQIINLNNTIIKLKEELKASKKECVKLKNELLFLKAKEVQN